MTGLKLLNTEYITKLTDGSEILIIIIACIIVIMLILGLSFLLDEDPINAIVMFVIGAAVFTLYFSPLIKYEEYKKYTLAIEDENYHIDLDKYEIVEKNGKEIIIKDKID